MRTATATPLITPACTSALQHAAGESGEAGRTGSRPRARRDAPSLPTCAPARCASRPASAAWPETARRPRRAAPARPAAPASPWPRMGAVFEPVHGCVTAQVLSLSAACSHFLANVARVPRSGTAHTLQRRPNNCALRGHTQLLWHSRCPHLCEAAALALARSAAAAAAASRAARRRACHHSTRLLAATTRPASADRRCCARAERHAVSQTVPRGGGEKPWTAVPRQHTAF